MLHVDLAAIASNARRTNTLAQAAGWPVQGVIKEGYARAPIVRAFKEGGIEQLAVSSVRAAESDGLAGEDIGRVGLIALATPAEARRVVRSTASSVHTCAETILACTRAASELGRPHDIFVALRTREGREGVDPDDEVKLRTLVQTAEEGGLGVVGVVAHFGCRLERPPTPAELTPVWRAAARLQTLGERRQSVSLGGTVLLPLLPACPAEFDGVLRIAEAVFAGSGPGLDSAFEHPFAYEAQVLEITGGRTGARQRVLVNAGATTVEPAEVRFEDPSWRLDFASSEYASLDLPASASLCVGDSVMLEIGWRSAIRALLSPAVPVRWSCRIFP